MQYFCSCHSRLKCDSPLTDVQHHIYKIRRCLASVLRVQGGCVSECAFETGKECVHLDVWWVHTLQNT